ncbi:uncharacterized protein [Periplaneta americana]|uniref:uncharacterized protein isoform X1 n=1 Tax=Periplaneta americana TaxID=6978 RepID=UPI0037E711B5
MEARSCMDIIHFPDSLGDLAVQALAKYISGLLINLVKLLKCRTPQVSNKNHIQETCSYLENLISNTVPPSLADDVTARLLAFLNVTFKQMMRSDHSECIRAVTSSLVSAIIHPLITKLEYTDCKKHPTLADFYYNTHQFDIIFLASPKMKNLKVLRIGVTSRMRLMYEKFISENLEEVSIHSCHDEDVSVLSNICKGLKSLDISRSWQLTDSCVASILKFRYLEELIMEDVSMSAEGLRKILEGIADSTETSRAMNLRSLSCDRLTNSDITLISEKFKNLTSFSLSRIVNNNLTPLKELKNLTKLVLKNGPFHLMIDLLQVIGKQLRCLQLERISEVNIRFVVEKCPLVHCLDLDVDLGLSVNSSVAEYSISNPFPNYLSVQCLHLSTPNLKESDVLEYIVSRCNRVKNLLLSCFISLSLFQKILMRKELEHLEEFLWRIPFRYRDIIVHFSEGYMTLQLFDCRSDRIPMRKYVITNEEFNKDPEFYFRQCLRHQLSDICTTSLPFY